MKSVQTAFSGVLLIILGLELMETLRVYFRSHRVRLETILAVAIIAVGRHVINLDVEHMSGGSLMGVAAVVLANGWLLSGSIQVATVCRLRASNPSTGRPGVPSAPTPKAADRSTSLAPPGSDGLRRQHRLACDDAPAFLAQRVVPNGVHKFAHVIRAFFGGCAHSSEPHERQPRHAPIVIRVNADADASALSHAIAVPK
jgi:hypothetical protein